MAFALESFVARMSLKKVSTFQQPTKRFYSTGVVSTTLFPSVIRLMHEYSLTLDNLAKIGTGPKGRLTKGDVLNYVSTKNLKPNPKPLPPVSTASSSSSSSSKTSTTSSSSTNSASSHQASSSSATNNVSQTFTSSSTSKSYQPPLRVDRKRTGPAAYEDIETSTMRRVIGQRLSESKWQIPHAYAKKEINVAPLVSLRKKLNASMVDEHDKLTVTDFLVRASALTLKSVPEANVTFNTKSHEVQHLDNIDVSIAVAIESGLITPIITNADKKSLSKIATDSRDLVTRARTNRLKPHEFQGGTFSITNLGMYGVTEFIGIINPPQSMILAVGAPVQRSQVSSQSAQAPSSSSLPTPSSASSTKPSINPESVSTMRVQLSYDSRSITPETAAKWLDHFASLLENPSSMLL